MTPEEEAAEILHELADSFDPGGLKEWCPWCTTGRGPHSPACPLGRAILWHLANPETP